ncbi:MAG: hypothetical protein KUG69_09085 [Marinosulfonomonas sp.]|nr:hypothetical protein [Marinosulfonomonas sp.]
MAGVSAAEYEQAVIKIGERLLVSIRVGATCFGPSPSDRIATVISVEHGALRQAYRLAPVFVAFNPAFRFGGDKGGRKFTIARWSADDANLDTVVQAISRLEPGWGGQRGIKGSPQRHPSRLSLQKVVGLVEKGFDPQKKDGDR